MEHLESDGAVVPDVACQKHGRLAAGAELALGPVAVSEPSMERTRDGDSHEQCVGRRYGRARGDQNAASFAFVAAST
jgi:hypothetical protein